MRLAHMSSQDMGIKRQNQPCERLVDEPRPKEWDVFQEPLLKDEQNELYKLDLVFAKGNETLRVDITERTDISRRSSTEIAEISS